MKVMSEGLGQNQFIVSSLAGSDVGITFPNSKRLIILNNLTIGERQLCFFSGKTT